MRFEPFSREGLRPLGSKMIDSQKRESANAAWPLADRSGWAWALVVIGLIIGFAVGSQLGTAETPSASI